MINTNPLTIEVMNKQEEWAHTQSTLYNVNFRWTLNNFSYRQGKIGQSLESPTFFSDANDAIKWCLQLYPNGESEKQKEFSSLYLKLVSELSIKSKIVGKFKFCILNAESNQVHTKNDLEARHFDTSSRSWGYGSFLNRSLILDEANGYLPEDKLTILCELNFVADNVDISSQKNTEKFKVPESRITNDFSNLRESQEFSDVTFIVGEYECPAHKAILAARSEVFATMLKHDMKERSSGRITITDVNHEVLQEMLHFIYTDECTKLKELAFHLLAAADKYALKKLKTMCEKTLFDKLSIETAIETLVLADLHSAEQLKEQTMNFITTHARDIIKIKGWQNMKNSNAHSALFDEILEALCKPPNYHAPIHK